MAAKLTLGTVQFGMDYGINNSNGKVTVNEAEKILDFAFKNGINILDTAYGYGDSEEVLGSIIGTKYSGFKLITKYPAQNEKEPHTVFSESLTRLKTNNLYGYLFHSYSTFKEKPEVWQQMMEWKKAEKIKKIGFSLYHPDEVLNLIENDIQFDIVQVPYSVFDQRFDEVFPLLKQNHVEVHVRSVFLQGLLFKKPESLSDQWLKIKGKLSRLHAISQENAIPISALCICFAALNSAVDQVVIGVDSLANLQENVFDMKHIDKVRMILPELYQLKENDESIILPYLWKKTT